MTWRAKLHNKGVVVSALGITQTLAWASTYYLTAVFADPVSADLRLSRSWFYGSVSAALLLSGLLGPLAGRMIDRYGGRDVLTATNLAFATGLVLLSYATGPISLFTAWLVLGIGMGFGLYEAAFATVAGLYGQQARNAITGITLVAGFASTVGWPLSAGLIDVFGWRGAVMAWAVLHLMIGLPLNRLLVPKSPLPAPFAMPDVATSAGVPWTVIILAGVFGATWFVSTALAAHLPRLLEAMGATPAAAIAAGRPRRPCASSGAHRRIRSVASCSTDDFCALGGWVASPWCNPAGADRSPCGNSFCAAARCRQRHADDRARHIAAGAVRICWLRLANGHHRCTGAHSSRWRTVIVRPGVGSRRSPCGIGIDRHADGLVIPGPAAAQAPSKTGGFARLLNGSVCGGLLGMVALGKGWRSPRFSKTLWAV